MNDEADADKPEVAEAVRPRRVERAIVGILAILAWVVAAVPWLVIVNGVADSSATETYIIHRGLGLTTLIATVIAIGLSLWWYALRLKAEGDLEEGRNRERTAKLRAKRDEALPAGEAQLARRDDANRDLLDEYQRPVRRQARSSYTLAQIANCVGLLVLIFGVGIILLANDSSAKLGVAGLTAVGAATSGYIARTYLRVYEHAQEQLNFYFREPLVTSYLLTAERLAEKLTGERQEEVYAEMVREIVRASGGDLSPTIAETDGPALRKAGIRRRSQ